MIYLNLLLVFICIVFIHEFGHYFFARLFKAEVTDFSIGFGKPLYTFTDKNNTVWKISPIPLGGYVKIKGLDTVFQKNSNEDPDSFQSLKLYQKILILFAGSFFNVVSAWFALFCVFFFFGIATFAPIIGNVADESSAQVNDLRVNEIIVLETDNNIKNINISDLGLFKLKNDDHVFVASVLGQFMDHKKGNRKQSKWSNELLLRIKEEKRNKL